MKKTLLTLIASLLLGGAVSAQNYWGNDPNSHAQSSNTPIVASVTLDGQAVDPNATYRLGAFVGDELRGIAAQHSDNNFWIQVFYNQGTSEDITFKLWDPTGEGTELTDYTLTYGALTALTTCEEGYGTPSNPVELNFQTVQTMTQTSTLAAGWTWWSSYTELGANSLTMLENGLGNNGVQILSRTNGYAIRNEYMGYVYWSGSLSSICNEQMYKIQTNDACNVSISGPRASLSAHPITIINGWNWIGFPSEQPMSVTDAFQSFSPEPNDQVKGRNGYATYSTYGSYGWWSGTLNTLEPGQGYMYNSNSNTSKVLTYQSSRGDAMIANIPSENNSFQPMNEIFANNMTVTAVIELEGEELRSEDYELAAFVGDQCRGSIKLMYVEPLNRYIAFLLVYGDDEVESLRFVLTDGKNVSWSKDYLMYSSDGIVGTPTEPAVLHFGALGVDDNSQKMVNVYPNPSNDIFNIEGTDIQKIEVIDNYGQIIFSKEVENDFIQISLNGRASGAYLLRVFTSNGVINNKLIKK